jgi:hypothetical protein
LCCCCAGFGWVMFLGIPCSFLCKCVNPEQVAV